ncbi:hypothetical protein B0T17DRAFT_537791 [Bombardia bombarda]|uniref:Uncharacterized protein n=1 Tax=Bombardia bombarda TaxID=252184 RepID=A0AA39WN29_9PEZI|nr:hypothetical protein B0T17DRAFT_537791 [Bombardia bombarda]
MLLVNRYYQKALLDPEFKVLPLSSILACFIRGGFVASFRSYLQLATLDGEMVGCV